MGKLSPRSRFRRPVRWLGRTGVAIMALLATSSCGQKSEEEGSVDVSSTGESRIAYLRSVNVEENDAVVNVTPTLVPDPLGGLLVVDASEAQIRRYSDEGRLIWSAGRRGPGPGEFMSPTVIGRLPTGEVVAGERHGRLTFFDPEGRIVIRTSQTRLRHLEELVVLDDSTLLISGVGEEGVTGPRLHMWSTSRDTILFSFFAPFPRQRNRAAATAAGYTEAAVRGDTIAAVFAASDTVYLFTRDGRAAGQLPLPSSHFRPAPAQGPHRTITDPVQRARWISAFDYLADVHWLPDGSLVLGYQSIDAGRALARRWHLVGMTMDGKRTFEYRNFARLVGADPEAGLVYLVSQSAEAPNQWNIARLPQP